MTLTSKLFLIPLVSLSCGFGNAQSTQGTIKIGDKAYSQEAFFVKIANTERPETRPLAFPRFEPGNYCVIVPDKELTVVDLYKDDVLASYKEGAKNRLPHSSENLECPNVMVFVSQKKWADFPRTITPGDDTERNAFVRKVEQRLQREAQETEAARITALPSACRERIKLILDWEKGQAGVKHSKKDEDEHYKESRRLGTLCDEQEAAAKK